MRINTSVDTHYNKTELLGTNFPKLGNFQGQLLNRDACDLFTNNVYKTINAYLH